jgi:hypothetical protein
MSNCEICGAMLEGGATCPRCGAELPADRSAKSLAKASLVIGSILALVAASGLAYELLGHGRLQWSLISLSSAALCWILVGFPMLEYKHPAVFLPVMGSAIIAYLWLMDGLTGASGWFLSLALPIALAGMASGSLATLLCLRARRRGPNVAAYILVSGTLACLAVEAVLSFHEMGRLAFAWSPIVAAAAVPVALLLLGIQHRLRQPS